MFRKHIVLLAGTMFGTTAVPQVSNEPLQNYAPGSLERKKLEDAVAKLLRECPKEVPVIIGGKAYTPGKMMAREIPSDRKKTLCHWWRADKELLTQATENSLETAKTWSRVPLSDRAAIILKAANLLSTTYRYELLAATMLGQSKNVWQAEIDAGPETIDFWRFNSMYAKELYDSQPLSPAPYNVWNQVEYRPLEGFVLSISPFNFTAIGANLAVAPALMGNTVVWKPSSTSLYANYVTYKVLEDAGLPPGVINFVPSRGEDVSELCVRHPDLAAVAFTGSTEVFLNIWESVGRNVRSYKTYPRLSGETGGKNYHLVHNSANINAAVACTVRAAFEYQGQKCSACSRLYVPKSMWPEFKEKLVAATQQLKVGPPDDFSSFVCAVIDEAAFKSIVKYIEIAKQEGGACLCGGTASMEHGYFIQPTIVESPNPMSTTMREEIFGPVLTCYVYDDNIWGPELFKLIDTASTYALTGSIFARERKAINEAAYALRNAQGNMYINDKSTGAVVGQQPFGGARGSGTNDKAGAPQFLSRWVSTRAVKEAFDHLTGISYPHQLPDSLTVQ